MTFRRGSEALAANANTLLTRCIHSNKNISLYVYGMNTFMVYHGHTTIITAVEVSSGWRPSDPRNAATAHPYDALHVARRRVNHRRRRRLFGNVARGNDAAAARRAQRWMEFSQHGRRPGNYCSPQFAGWVNIASVNVVVRSWRCRIAHLACYYKLHLRTRFFFFL